MLFRSDSLKLCLIAPQFLCRHFDTARMYNNEDHLGEAIKESGVPREELFISQYLGSDPIHC